jgi:hypothetical protein
MLNSLKSKEASSISKEEALLVIKNYISKEVGLIQRKMIADEAFDSPAWSERQASLLGALKFADKILNFIPDQGK